MLDCTPLHPLFAAEIVGVDLREARDPALLAAIRAAMDRYAVLVFRDQPFTDTEQVEFAARFDGRLHTQTSLSALGANRFGNEALTDISSVRPNGELADVADRRRLKIGRAHV